MTRPDIDRAAVVHLNVERARRMGLPLEAPSEPSPEPRWMLWQWCAWWLHGAACGVCAALTIGLFLGVIG